MCKCTRGGQNDSTAAIGDTVSFIAQHAQLFAVRRAEERKLRAQKFSRRVLAGGRVRCAGCSVVAEMSHFRPIWAY